MIDLHCHIIPYIDDGAKSIKIACSMAKLAWRSGVNTIVATPHCNLRNARKNYLDQDFLLILSSFRAVLRQQGIPITILPGAEVFAHADNIRELIDHRQLATINGSRYLLVEFPFHQDGKLISTTLDAISRRGLIPVIAHPERYDTVQEHPSYVARWLEQGCVIQINKGSLLGRLGRNAHACAKYLIANQYVHVIASDAHDMNYRPPGFFRLLQSKQIPPAYVKLLLKENPLRIVSNEPVLNPRNITFD